MTLTASIHSDVIHVEDYALNEHSKYDRKHHADMLTSFWHSNAVEYSVKRKVLMRFFMQNHFCCKFKLILNKF